MDHLNVRPFPKPPPDVARLLESYRGSRTENFGRVITAVEGAIEPGDEQFALYLEEMVFPFLEAEQEKAAAEEGFTPVLEWHRSILGV